LNMLPSYAVFVKRSNQIMPMGSRAKRLCAGDKQRTSAKTADECGQFTEDARTKFDTG
jgi:hypothetical protein